MEFNCPNCGKRLRAPDHLRNPLVRCRTCGTAFRPREQAEVPVAAEVVERRAAPVRSDKIRPVEPTPLPKPFPAFPTTTNIPSPTQQSRGMKGLGAAIAILFVLLAKAPRLVRLMVHQQPPPLPHAVPMPREERDFHPPAERINKEHPPFDRPAEKEKAPTANREAGDEVPQVPER